MECIRVTEANEKKTVAELFAQSGNREKACIVLMKGGPEKVVVKTKSWVYQIVRNKITDFYRAKKDTVEFDDQLSEGQQVRRIEIRGACSLLPHALNQLPQMYREVFELSEKGMSHKEIADSLGISVDLSKQRLSRAKKMLEEEFQHAKCTRVHIDPKDMSVTVSEEKITLEQAKIIDEMINERKDDL